MISRQTSSVDLIKAAWGPFTEHLGVTLGVPAVMVFVPFILVFIPTCTVAFFVAGGAAFLDKPATAASNALHKVIPAGPVKDLLSGTPLGHPAHPMLVTIPIGAWVSASLLDAFGGPEARTAARRGSCGPRSRSGRWPARSWECGPRSAGHRSAWWSAASWPRAP